MESYRNLEERYRRLADVSGALSVLHWDRSTVMPDGGAEARTAQMATLNVIAHRMQTDRELGDLLSAAEDRAGALDPFCLREEWNKHWAEGGLYGPPTMRHEPVEASTL